MSKFIQSFFMAVVAFGMASAFADSAVDLSLSGNKVSAIVKPGIASPSSSGAMQLLFPNGVWHPSNNPVTIYKPVNIPTPQGGTIPGSVRVPVPPRAIGKALAKALPFVGSFLTLHELLSIDWGLSIDNGQVVIPATPTQGRYQSSGIWNRPGCSTTVGSLSTQCLDCVRQTSSNWTDTTVQHVGVNAEGACGLTIEGFYAAFTPFDVVPASQATPYTQQQFEDWVSSQTSWPSRTSPALNEAIQYPEPQQAFGEEVAAQPSTQTQVQITGADASGKVTVGSPKVKTREYTDAQGNPIRETKTETTTATAEGNTVTYNTTTTTQVTNLVTNQTTTTESTSGPKTSTTPDDGEDLECGLPGTPACKIDETGTPDPIAETQAQQDADNALSATKEFFDGLQTALPELPSLNWTFSLPTGCSTIDMPGFSADVPSLGSINMCQYQPMVHDLMSMIWAGVGLFVAIGMVFKESTGKA